MGFNMDFLVSVRQLNLDRIRPERAHTKPDAHEGIAMTDDKDVFDEDGDEALDDFQRLSEALFQRVADFAEEEDVPDEVLSPLLLQLSLSMRMVAYTATAAKPSAGGLKLDLDRFVREVGDLIRETKKDADQIIAQAKESIAAAEAEAEEE
jgi:hypothetical protein